MASIELTPKPINDITQIMSRSRPQPPIIQSEALLQSMELLSKLEYQVSEDNKSFVIKQCGYCSNRFPTVEGRNYSCKVCNEVLCFKHRDLLNHHCEKVSPNLEKYLMAKNTFKTKLKEIKMKGH